MTADEAYGKDGKFRAWLEQRRASATSSPSREEPGRRRRRRKSRAGRADRARPGPGLEAPQLRKGGPRSPGLRLGGRQRLPEDGTELARLVPRYLLVRRSLTPDGKE